jgi:hypothetical protein
VVDAELYGIAVDVQPPPQELDVTHSRGYGYTPSDSGIGQREHQRAMIPGFTGQPANLPAAVK